MNCNLCPNLCNIDRTKTFGLCGTSDKLRIAKYYLHKFEEPCISGTNGSGTVFFCGCSLKCVFCQNYELSQNMRGKDITVNELAEIFGILEKQGAHNINLVNPTQNPCFCIIEQCFITSLIYFLPFLPFGSAV